MSIKLKRLGLANFIPFKLIDSNGIPNVTVVPFPG